jgi:ketosteroid isomerase-like protein
MPQENVEIVRRVNTAINSEDMDRVLALLHPEFETVVGPELSPEPDAYRGHDGVRRYFDSFREAMEQIRFEPARFREAGGSVVVALRLTARGRSTGIHVEQRLGQVWTIDHGRAIRVQNYVSYREALEAAEVDPDPSRRREQARRRVPRRSTDAAQCTYAAQM